MKPTTTLAHVILAAYSSSKEVLTTQPPTANETFGMSRIRRGAALPDPHTLAEQFSVSGATFLVVAHSCRIRIAKPKRCLARCMVFHVVDLGYCQN